MPAQSMVIPTSTARAIRARTAPRVGTRSVVANGYFDALAASPTYYKLHGYTPEEVVRESFVLIFLGDY